MGFTRFRRVAGDLISPRRLSHYVLSSWGIYVYMRGIEQFQWLQKRLKMHANYATRNANIYITLTLFAYFIIIIIIILTSLVLLLLTYIGLLFIWHKVEIEIFNEYLLKKRRIKIYRQSSFKVYSLRRLREDGLSTSPCMYTSIEKRTRRRRRIRVGSEGVGWNKYNTFSTYSKTGVCRKTLVLCRGKAYVLKIKITSPTGKWTVKVRTENSYAEE